MKYQVRVNDLESHAVTYVYEVEADTLEEAQDAVMKGDANEVDRRTHDVETTDRELAENQPEQQEPEHKDTQADVDQAIRRLKEIQARSKGGAA
jgi:hypothetical protein